MKIKGQETKEALKDYIKRLEEEARKRKWKYYMEIVKDFFFRKRR